MLLFAASVFLSALLLFQIQPLIARFILPWFGGTPAVWSTAMLFFQLLLTAGYAYAYWLMGRPQAKQQSVLHLLLVAASLLLLSLYAYYWPTPITPPLSLRPEDVSTPILDVFGLLLVVIALPYFVLASNGPLMQAWFGRCYSQHSYARLYALSNVGSLLGLLSYPLLVEPWLTLQQQGWLWSGAYVAFALLLMLICWRQRGFNPISAEPVAPSPTPEGSLKLLWITLAATASLLLLAITNQLSQEVAVIPFLWVLPLSLYLISFILSFGSERSYSRRLYVGLTAVLLVGLLLMLFYSNQIHIYGQIALYAAFMFCGCMLCHGELYKLRPSAQYLTSYYLMISIGGAMGGLFVSLIAPLIFDGYWELMVALAMTLALVLVLMRQQGVLSNAKLARFMLISGALSAGLLSLSSQFAGALFAERNFFGVIRVREVIANHSHQPAYAMSHGATIHGLQLIAPTLRQQPTSYYLPESGGLILQHHPKAGQGLRVGILGLGIGTLLSYARLGDYYRLYEINELALNLAQGQGGYFSFLSNSAAKTDAILGDARIALEQELARGKNQQFDVLVLDTFSSDAIPIHLVTQQAFALYLQHLKPDGVIAAHISNLHLDLKPVFSQLAQHYGLHIRHISHNGQQVGGQPSDWLLLTRNSALLEIPAINQHSQPVPPSQMRLWTDDYSNLVGILK